MVKQLTGVVVCIFTLCGWAGAQPASMPMADRVPADAVAYIGWAGADSQTQAYHASDLAAFLDHSNLSQIAAEYLPKIWNQLEGESGKKEAVAGLQKSLPILWHHPTAIYVSNVTINADGTPNANVALVCDAGADAAQLQENLQALIKDNPHLKVAVDGSQVLLGVDDSINARKGGPTLADAPGFIATMKSLQATPAIAVYVDVKTMLQKADDSAATNQMAQSIWPKVKEALGISAAKTFAMTAGFDGSNWMTASILDAPAPRTGLLAVIEPKPIDPVLLAHVPATAGSVSVFNFDVAKLFDTIGNAMAANPASEKVFHQAAGLATIGLGRSFRSQILGPLGTQWVMYSDAKLHSVVVLNHPNDADTAADSMVSATFGLVNLANTQIPGASTQPVVEAVQKTVKGIDITSAVTKYASPTFAVKDGILYFGLSMDSIVASATLPAVATSKDLLHSDNFMAALHRVNVPQFASFDYCDLPDTAPQAYDNFGKAGEQMRHVMSMFNIEVPKVELPPLDELKSHLSPAISVSWADENGVYSKAISPFPLSTYLLGDPQQSMVGMTTLSAATAVLIPARERAREQAKLVQTMSNERQIVVALMMYATSHHGQYPPDLGTLVTDGEVDSKGLSIFLKPKSSIKLPDGLADQTKDQLATWVNENAEFMLLTPGVTLSTMTHPSEAPVLVPKDGDHATARVPVGFADGHVEGCKPERVQRWMHPDQQPDNP